MKQILLANAKSAILFAIAMAENAINAILLPLGENGLELNYRPNDGFSPIAESKPYQFRKIVKVRCHTFEGLQMLCDGSDKWEPLNTSDYVFLIDEIESALRAEDMM